MKVKELISELKKYPPNENVCVRAYGGDFSIKYIDYIHISSIGGPSTLIPIICTDAPIEPLGGEND